MVKDKAEGLQIGSVINDRYKLEEHLGEGGMGVVYRGHDTMLDRQVAVKLLSGAGLGSQGKVRLLHEAKAVAKLNHTHIVSIYDAGEVDETAYIVMELIEGKSLREMPVSSLSDTLTFVNQICLALDHAHQMGIIHRDLKPENIMLTPDQTIKLVDFGLALAGGRARITEEGTMVGTFSYIAPELIQGQDATPQSDLYALGVVMYELTTGRAPFVADNLVEVISQHIHAPVIPPTKYNPAIPPALEYIIIKLLSKDLHDRPESATQLIADLEPVTIKLTSSSILPTKVKATSEKSSDRIIQLNRMVRGRMVGRKEEIGELREFWDRASKGEGHMVLLSGEPGVGKTRLSKELAVYAQLRGGLVMKGHFHPELGAPYIGFWETLNKYLQSITPEEAKEQVGSGGPELIKLVPEIGELIKGIVASSPMGEVEAEQIRLFNQVSQFLSRIAINKPILLMLEDLHWADKPSLLLLYFLVRNVLKVPILILGTYREVDLELAKPFYETLLGLNREHLYSRIVLDRLSKEGVGEMLSLFLDGPVDNQVINNIMTETKGNPFFVEEIIKALVEQNAISEQDGTWKPAQGIQLEVPQSIQLAVGGRLERLSENTKKVLTQAAVLGREFDTEILLAMGDWNEDDLIDALDEAEEAQVIHELKGTGSDKCDFEHALFVQVIYDDINNRRRARIHQQAGEAIEKVYAKQIDQHVEQLSHHFSLARTGAADKAAEYSLQAAKKAVKVYAHDQAVRYYQTALDALEDLGNLEKITETWESLGDTHTTTNFTEKALGAYEKALEAREKNGQVQDEKTGKLYRKLGYSEIDREKANQYYIQALSLTPESESAERAIIQSKLAEYTARTNLTEGTGQMKVALKLAEDTNDPIALASVYDSLCIIHIMEDDLEGFLDSSRKQAKALEGTDDYHGRFHAYWNASAAAWIRGKYKEGEAFAIEAQGISEKLNAPGWESLTLAMFTSIFVAQGRWDEVLIHTESILPLFKQMGGNNCFCYIFAGFAEIEARRGFVDEAQIFMSNAQDVWKLLDAPKGVKMWQFFEHFYLREWENAWAVVEELREQKASTLGSAAPNIFLYSSMMPEVAARVGHYTEAVSSAKEVIEKAQSPEVPPLIASAHFALGLANAGQENWDAALSEYKDSLQRFKDLGKLWDIANLQYEIGLAHINRGQSDDKNKAQEYLVQALKGFEDLKAKPGMIQVQDALEKIN